MAETKDTPEPIDEDGPICQRCGIGEKHHFGPYCYSSREPAGWQNATFMPPAVPTPEPSVTTDPLWQRIACGRLVKFAPMFVIVGPSSMANPLGSDLDYADDRRFNPSGKVFIRVEDVDAALTIERQQHRDALAAIEAVIREELCPVENSESQGDDEPEPRYICMDEDGDRIIEADDIPTVIRQVIERWDSAGTRCQAAEATVAAQAQEIADLKADQQDWRKGVALIASSLGDKSDNLSCVRIAEVALEMRAEAEEVCSRLTAVEHFDDRGNREWCKERAAAARSALTPTPPQTPEQRSPVSTNVTADEVDRLEKAAWDARVDHALVAIRDERDSLRDRFDAMRSVALDAIAAWQGEDDSQDGPHKRSRSARTRATLRARMHALEVG